MTGKPERNREPKNDLGDLRSRVAKMPPLIECPQPKRKMDHGRYVERVVDERKSPPSDMVFQPCLHGIVRNVAKRMIEKMRKDVGEHDEAGGDADLTHADAAQPSRKPGMRPCADVTDSGGLYRHAEPLLNDKQIDQWARRQIRPPG